MKVVGISEISRKASDLRKLYQSIQKEADGFLNSHDVFSMKDVKTYDDPRLKQINAILKDKNISKEVKAVYEEEKVWLLKKQVKILTHCLDGFIPESKDVLIFYQNRIFFTAGTAEAMSFPRLKLYNTSLCLFNTL